MNLDDARCSTRSYSCIKQEAKRRKYDATATQMKDNICANAKYANANAFGNIALMSQRDRFKSVSIYSVITSLDQYQINQYTYEGGKRANERREKTSKTDLHLNNFRHVR